MKKVEEILCDTAIGFMWLMLCAYIVLMAGVGVWYRWEVISIALGL